MRAAWRWVMQTRTLQIVQYELTLYALREGADWLAERQYDAYVQLYYGFLLRAVGGTGDLTPGDCKAAAHFMLAGVDGLIVNAPFNGHVPGVVAALGEVLAPLVA